MANHIELMAPSFIIKNKRDAEFIIYSFTSQGLGIFLFRVFIVNRVKRLLIAFNCDYNLSVYNLSVYGPDQELQLANQLIINTNCNVKHFKMP